MFFAIRTVRAFWIIAAAVGAAFGAVAIVAALFPGERHFWDAYKYWLIGLPAIPIVWAAAEGFAVLGALAAVLAAFEQ